MDYIFLYSMLPTDLVIVWDNTNLVFLVYYIEVAIMKSNLLYYISYLQKVISYIYLPPVPPELQVQCYLYHW